MSVFFSKGLFERETKVSSSSSSLYSGRRRALEEEEDKMVSSRIATQTTTTTTTTNGIVVATKKTKKVRCISVCFLSSFAQQRFCRLVDFLYDGREFSGRDGMLRRQRRVIHRRLSLDLRVSRIFFSARAGVVPVPRCGRRRRRRRRRDDVPSRCARVFEC